MKHLVLSLSIAAGLVGCATTPRFSVADDPSTECYAALPKDPRLAPLHGKVPLTNPDNPPVQLLVSTARPTEDERAALLEWAEKIAACGEVGRSYRAAHAPPGWASALDRGHAAAIQAITALYQGGPTYGQFNTELQRIAQVTRKNLEDARDEQASRNIAEQSLMLQRLQLMQSFAPKPSPSVTCTSRSFGSTIRTTCD